MCACIHFRDYNESCVYLNFSEAMEEDGILAHCVRSHFITAVMEYVMECHKPDLNLEQNWNVGLIPGLSTPFSSTPVSSTTLNCVSP